VKAECEGETFLDQEEEGYYLHPALNDTFPGFIEQVQGMKIGEEKEFSLILPDDYSEEKLAGKETLFKISVVEIKKKCLPELDDEFVKSLGRGIETVDLFREQIASDLKSMRKREARLKLEEKIVDAVIGLAQVDFPLVFVEEDIDYLLDNQKRQVEGSGLRWKDYLNLNNKKEEEIRNELRPLAERHITRLLVLNKIRELENIEIKLEEIDGEIERAIEEIGYFNPAQNLNALQSTLLNRKVVRHLIEIATAEKEAGPQEEGKEDEQGN
jgi:trigger factor